jgi:hypothetical protein
MKEGTAISGFAVNPVVYPKPSWEILLWPSAIVFAATVLLSLISIGRVNDNGIADTLRHG